MKDVHELRQIIVTKLASCMPCLDLWDGAMRNYCIEAAQISTNLEALENRVAVTVDILVHAGLC